MKHIFLDTNIVIDVLSERKPFSVSSSKILNLAAENKAIFYLSTISYQIINFVLKKGEPRKSIITLLLELKSITETLDVSASIIRQALKSDFADFEDAVQYYCAISNSKIDTIITRNVKDYKLSTLSVMTPEEFLALFQSTEL